MQRSNPDVPRAIHPQEHSTMLVNNIVLPPCYSVPICLTKNMCNINVNAILDSGSPISLIRESNVRDWIIETVPNLDLRGINQSKLDILGSIKFNLFVADIEVELSVFVVNDNAIPCPCLLGRDFISNPKVNVTFSNNAVTIKGILDDVVPDINNLMLIDIGDDIDLNLDIGNGINAKQRLEFVNLFKAKYLYAERNTTPMLNFTGSIKLEPNHMKFFYRPRRLSYQDKQIVNEMIQDLLQRGIIKKSCSPYASPIVLVAKKMVRNVYA